MKVTTFILATYISLLTVQPVEELIYALLTNYMETSNMTCCENKQLNNTKQDPNSCCGNGVCNPFGMCSCCFFYKHTQTTIQYYNLTQINKLNTAVEKNLVSSFISDCFHPPEIA
jgi:hypothetical protein